MNRFTRNTVILALGAVLLTGCGASSSQNTDSSTSNTNSTTSNTKTDTKTVDLKTGLDQLLALAEDIQAQIKNNADSKIKEDGNQLETTWHSFEDQVKSKYPQQYDQVEKYLNPVKAGSQVTPLDKKTIQDLDSQLIQVLNELKQKEK